MDANSIGTRAEGAVMAALLASGRNVLIPFGTLPYDLVFEDDEGFHRLQVKTGREYRGVLNFAAFSRVGADRRTQVLYHGKVDYFGVYLPTRNTCYLVPIADVGGEVGAQGLFRLDPPKNNQAHGVRYAEQHLIKPA